MRYLKDYKKLLVLATLKMNSCSNKTSKNLMCYLDNEIGCIDYPQSKSVVNHRINHDRPLEFELFRRIKERLRIK